LRVLEQINRPNVGLTVDYWHFFVAGDTPEDVAQLDRDLIKAVHVCDGRPVAPGEVPDQAVHRDIMTGGGVIPLQEYTDAVKATGYDGWYCPEIFCAKTAELDHLDVAVALRSLLQILVA
jgi:sugar phosphate isomerase/epimerase